MKKGLPIRSILGVPCYSGSRVELLNLFASVIDKPFESTLIVYTPNPEQLVLAKDLTWFAALFQSSDVNLPDGNGLIWAMKRQAGKQISLSRLAGREVFADLLLLAKERELRVMLVGGKEGSGEAVIKQWGAGGAWKSDEGANDIRQESAAEKKRVLEAIASYKPDMLFVAYGAPWQEKWIAENKDCLNDQGVKIAMVVGGALDYEAGKVRKVPAWMSSAHLEWLWRLIQEPWRWKRQLRGLRFFIWILLGKKEL